MQFDFVDLRLFVYIAEEKSLTKAANRAHMSLPAASMRIKNLEQSIGTPLLNRVSQGITLRPSGQAFLHHARQVLNQVEVLRADLQEYAKGIKGHVRIIANTTAITEFLPDVLRTFLVSHPDVNIDLSERLSNDIVRAVSTGVTDIGIVAGTVNTEGLHVVPYRNDRLVLAVSSAHPLAEKDEIAFEDTIEYNYVGLHEGSAIHSFLHRAASEINRQLKMRIQVSSFEAECRMIEANVGIGMLPESSARRHAKNQPIKLLRLTNDWAIRNLLICVRELESLPFFANELIDLLVEDANRAEAEEYA
ncbi:LysR family transcriptional regulator [Noviherbaspirillum sedimenti]|uniref:LysR family transcriptional regulator n=1 Tax=Noviherbaspirillum sedimenti TaxID=2320865 RepID=A0A3A3G917_9BURK|nr:LysR family transcriptional regulator [Noviherbaspirillum sedimenti]RJG04471.1 LysR family transcriptional regulator [Noviherbaspirillum sedimenti]